MMPGERVVLRGHDGPVGEILSVGMAEPGDLGPALDEDTLVKVYWGMSDGRRVEKIHRLGDLDLGPLPPLDLDGTVVQSIYVRDAFENWLRTSVGA